MKATIEKIISLAKRRGFVFQGSEIYGGLANTWDYGPLGVQLKRNIKDYWWRSFVRSKPNIYGLDAAILMNPRVWEASGHVGGFSDPLVDCLSCKNRFRADKLIDEHYNKHQIKQQSEGLSLAELRKKLDEYQIKCPKCGSQSFTDIRSFNLMFKTHQGVIEDSQSLVYLRPETAQGIFVNFKNICNTGRAKLPFGVAQIGKAFRNEISPGNFIFRTREFEQMEIEYFCTAEQANGCFEVWQRDCFDWLLSLGIEKSLIRLRQHSAVELSHYSKATTDIEFNFPFGWGELWGIAHRGNYDLSQHQKFSGKDLEYFDSTSNQKILPHVIEPSLGVDRLLLSVLTSAYCEDEVSGEMRTFLKFDPKIAPVNLGVLPLTKKQNATAEKIADSFRLKYALEYDTAGSIGKRYRRLDEIGAPFCITVDFETETDNSVTVRNRDTLKQERVGLDFLDQYLSKLIN